MDIYYSLKDIGGARPSVVALGFFDGLHIGHTALLSRTITLAKENGLSADVFTFRVHPKNVMAGKTLVPRLQTQAEKLKRLAALGINRVFDFDFADGFHTMQPEIFAQKLIKDAFSAKIVVCGFNFRFGAAAAGDTETLRVFGKEFGFETHMLEPVYAARQLVSSTIIRRYINSGELETASRLLGRNYSLSGAVADGRDTESKHAAPAVSILPDADMTLPPFGSYITETSADGISYPSVSNIGISSAASDGGAVSVETRLSGTAPGLSGKTISVAFKKKLKAV